MTPINFRIREDTKYCLKLSGSGCCDIVWLYNPRFPNTVCSRETQGSELLLP